MTADQLQPCPAVARGVPHITHGRCPGTTDAYCEHGYMPGRCVLDPTCPHARGAA